MCGAAIKRYAANALNIRWVEGLVGLGGCAHQTSVVDPIEVQSSQLSSTCACHSEKALLGTCFEPFLIARKLIRFSACYII